MSEITIVTGFININRGNWNSFNRTAEEYLKYFEFWARIQNRLVVYVDNKELGDKVLKIRKKFGLESRTIINIVEDITSLDPELYCSIKNATENKTQIEFRTLMKNPESWNGNYNYVMLLKEWFVKDAVEKKQAEGMVAWLDFGFNHGGATYYDENDFDFLWEYDFPKKINIFTIKDLDDRPIFDLIRTMDTYIMGPIIVAQDELWIEFWNLMRNAMISLNDCGLTDDDQNIILMSYKKNPEIFNVYKSNWFLPLKEFGGDHLKVRTKKNRNTFSIILRNIAKKVKKTNIHFKYIIREFKYLQRVDKE